METSKIDWSKAPEGANQYQPAATPNNRPVFWRVEDGVAREVWAMNPDGSVRDHFTYGPDGCAAYCPLRSIARPVEWNGEGLPPAGLEVEWKQGSNHEWVRATVIAYFRHEAWISVNGDNPFTIGNPGGFRPIRTPEQIAAEERRACIATLAQHICADGAFDVDDPEVTAAAAKIYDAGYRRQVTQ